MGNARRKSCGLRYIGDLVTAMDPELHRHLDQIFAEDDRLRCEHAAWMAARSPAASPPVSATSPPGVIYKEYHSGALPAAVSAAVTPMSEPDVVEWHAAWNAWLAGHLDIHDGEMVRAVGEFSSQYVTERLVPLQRELAQLRAENAEVKNLLAEALRRFDEVAKRNGPRILLPGE
jgi:hypothetical protein